MTKNEMVEFKSAVAAMIDILIRDALNKGMPTDAVFLAIGAESLELAARIHVNHGGTDRRFIGMACDLLDAVRTGTAEQ